MQNTKRDTKRCHIKADWKHILSQFRTWLRRCVWRVGIVIMPITKWRIRWSKTFRKASHSWLGLGIQRSHNITLFTHAGNILPPCMGFSLMNCKRESDTCYYSSLLGHFKRLRITLPKKNLRQTWRQKWIWRSGENNAFIWLQLIGCFPYHCMNSNNSLNLSEQDSPLPDKRKTLTKRCIGGRKHLKLFSTGKK